MRLPKELGLSHFALGPLDGNGRCNKKAAFSPKARGASSPSVGIPNFLTTLTELAGVHNGRLIEHHAVAPQRRRALNKSVSSFHGGSNKRFESTSTQIQENPRFNQNVPLTLLERLVVLDCITMEHTGCWPFVKPLATMSSADQLNDRLWKKMCSTLPVQKSLRVNSGSCQKSTDAQCDSIVLD